MSTQLQDKVNHFMIKEVSSEMVDVMAAVGFVPDPKDGTETVSVENLHKVVIPTTMSKLQASHNLLKQFKEEETLRDYNRKYEHFFLNDFMLAMNTMIKRYFGMLHVSHVNTEGKKAANDYIQIPVRYNEKGDLISENGYVGSIKAPCWEDAILDIYPNFIIVRAKLKFEKQVNSFLSEVEEYIKHNSVVTNCSVTIEANRNGSLSVKPINPKMNKTIVLDSEVERVVNNLIIPSLADRSKTSLLFTGDFGTGKTETAIRVGVEGQKRYGRTFFYLHNAELFATLIPYLKNYQPSIVFAEDVDQISAGDRDSSMNDLLNQLDGNELKNVNCTFIFTTNNHNKIHKAMRRPGRIDQVVHFDYCTKESVAKIFALYVKDMVGADTVDYALAAEAAPENLQGAVVAEISRRAVKYAAKLHNNVVSTDVFLDAIASMKHHIKFMREDQEKDHSAENLLGHLMFKGMKKAFPKLGVESEDWLGSDYEGLN